LRGLLASECDAFEALEFADGLLDACPRLVEYFRKAEPTGRGALRPGMPVYLVYRSRLICMG
jgi:hypothetical protein